MGDKYSSKHQKKNPKRTEKQIEEDRIKRNKSRGNGDGKNGI